MGKYLFYIAILLNLSINSAFAFEITNTKENYIPYSRFLENININELPPKSSMSEEQQKEISTFISETLSTIKNDFPNGFEQADDIKLTLYEGYTPFIISFPTVFTKNLEIPDNNIDIAWLDAELTKTGAKRYRSAGLSATYYLRVSNEKQCYIKLSDNEPITLTFICSYIFPSNSAIELTSEDFSTLDNKFVFSVNSLEGKSQNARISIKGEKDAVLKIKYFSNLNYESYENICETEKNLEIKKSNEFVLDDLPPVDGQLYVITSIEGNIEKITIKMESESDIPDVKYGKEFGTVVIKGIDSSLGAELIPYSRINGNFDNIEQNLKNPVQDDIGNYVFSAPAGYYRLLFGKNPYIDMTGKFYSQNIPVSSGETTEIIIPNENLKTVNELKKQYVSADENKLFGNIQVTSLNVKNETGTLEMIINDPKERDVFPEKDEIKVSENGVEGKVTKIEREPQPVDVVLVLDSSGSMGKNMQPAVEAAKSFVKSLPDKTNIRFIQFAQKITIHKGETKSEVIKALDTVKSVGATAMYDALDKALKLLENKKKPYIVLFSDGADSREPGVDGKGSDLTKEQIITKLAKSKATLLTIGFGKGHDPKTLKAMSEVTPNGIYISAADKNALPKAFAIVASKFGNQFKVSYNRPYTSIDAKSDLPVIAMMMDCSGSMDMDPAEAPEDDVDYRMDKVKNVFHDFIVDLPSKSLISLMTFKGGGMAEVEVNCNQVLTDNKSSILKALSEMNADGGTPINDALTFAINNLKPVSSSKKLLIFFTDAALDIESKYDESIRVKYEELLKELKKENIRVLFAGLGGKNYIDKHKAPFEEAAKLAGGDYVITSDTKDITKKLNELLKKIDEPISTTKKLTLNVALDSKTDDGSRMNYSAVKTYDDFKPLEMKGQIVKPGTITIKTGQSYAFKPQVKVKDLVSNNETADSTKLFNSIKFQNKPAAHNKFAEIEAKELHLLKIFKGFEPTKGIFAALKLNISFKKSNNKDKEIGYEIPSIFNHFYLSINNSSLTAPSKLTWLTETPLTKIPEKVSVFVDEKNNAEGFLVFDMPFMDGKEGLDQISLHMFDETNGHIEIPIVGRMSEKLEKIKQLPNTEPQKISDAFSLKIKGYEDRQSICKSSFDNYSNATFRVIEADFISKVSALLNIKPIDRFYYAIETDNGALMSKMNNIVYNMPLGFYSKLMFAPGSDNTVRMPFVIGKEMTKTPSYIWGDVAKGDIKCKISDGKPWSGKNIRKKYTHEYFDLYINDIGRINENRTAIVDFTIVDKPDQEGLGTGGLTTLFALNCKAAMPENLEKSSNGGTIIKAITRRGLGDFASTSGYEIPGRIEPDIEYMKSLVYGVDDEWGAFDGQNRRGIIAFKLTDGYENSDDWELISDHIPSLKIKLPNSEFTNKALLVENMNVDFDSSLDDRIDEAISLAKARYETIHKEIDKTPTIGLSDNEKPLTTVSVPALTTYGKEILASVSSERNILSIFNRLKIYSSQQMDKSVIYSPEAVITQGWGNEEELIFLAETLFAKLGYTTTRRTVCLTESGAKTLNASSNINWEANTNLIALEYKQNGKSFLFVPAFGNYLNKLSDLCYFKSHEMPSTDYTVKYSLTVSIYGKLIGDAGMAAQNAIANNIFGALGGSESTETDNGIMECTTLFNRSFTAKDFSSDMFDVSFQSAGKSSDGKGDIICAVIDTPDGVLVDNNRWIDTSCYEIESVTIQLGDKIKTTRLLKKGNKLTNLHFTIGHCIPEISDEAAKSYEDYIKLRAEGIKDSSDYTKAKWNNHAAIARLVKSIGKASNEVSNKLDVKVPRTYYEDVLSIAAICESDGKNATIGIDLMNIAISENSINNSEKVKCYNTIIGLLASQLEGTALPGGKGQSYVNVWASSPKNTGLCIVDETIREQVCETLKENNFPKLLTDRMSNEEARDISYIIPTAPGVRNGVETLAWLEYNANNGLLISVFDNGERSALAGYVLGLNPYNEANYVAGAMVGVSCSNMAIAAYTLETDNYEAVLKTSKKLMEALSDMISGIESIGNKPSIEAFIGENTLGFTSEAIKQNYGFDINKLYNHYKIWSGNGTYSPTFAEGFGDAVKLFFINVK